MTRRLRFPRALLLAMWLLACASTPSAEKQRHEARDAEGAIAGWQSDHPTQVHAGDPDADKARSKLLAVHAAPEDPCKAAAREAEALWVKAAACTRDAECVHYPSTCTAIGDNPAADELVELDNWRNKNCDIVPDPFCGPTTPVCNQGKCDVNRLPSKLDPRP